ncbi:MAG: lipid-A-disaccharide synthase [Planctomycetota bacterium]
MKKIFILAGEPSGDLYGSEIIKALNAKGSYSFVGMGGHNMVEAGMDCVQSIDNMNVMGFIDVFKKIFFFLDIIKKIKKIIIDLKPDAVITLDYPGFNLRISEFAKSLGIPTYHFVAPQVWAWRQSRAKKLSRKIDHLFVFHSFELPFFKAYMKNVHYIGHPLHQMVNHKMSSDSFSPTSDRFRICLAPGSRLSEINDLLPVFRDAVLLFDNLLGKNNRPNLDIVISQTKNNTNLALYNVIKDSLNSASMSIECRLSNDPLETVVLDRHITLVVSGTATLVCGLAGCPMIVCYKTGNLSLAIARRLLDIPVFSLVNIVADTSAVPELGQEQSNPQIIAHYILGMYKDKDVTQYIKRELDNIIAKGERGSPMNTAADFIDLSMKKPETNEN